MENHTTEEFTGLESLGNSQVVTNMAEFLSLESLGLTPNNSANDFIPLDNVNKTVSETPKDEEVIPTQSTEEPPKVILPNLNEGKDNTDDLGLSELDKGVIKEGEEDTIPSQSTTNYKSVLSELIAEGIIPGIEAFTNEDGTEVPFEEMEIDKETLLSLIKDHQEEMKEEFKTNSIEVKGISDFTKQLINIEKHGGNVQQALETYQQVKHPIETIDLTDVRGQKAMCFLRLQAQGIDENIAKDVIKSYEMQGVLEDKAFESKEQLDEAFVASMAQQEQKAIEEEQNFKAALKTYRATLDNVFKDQSISDTHRRKLLDIATKQNENGDFELDNLIKNFRKNPIDAADLIMFITNKEEFIKSKAAVALNEERKSTLRKVSVIPKARATNTNVPEKTLKEKDPYLLDLSNL